MLERLLITSAAAWCISYALTSTHGAFGMFERLREWHGGKWHGRRVSKRVEFRNGEGYEQTTTVHGLLDCVICLIFWLALLIGYLEGLTIIESIAAAGVGLWMHGFTGWRFSPPS